MGYCWKNRGVQWRVEAGGSAGNWGSAERNKQSSCEALCLCHSWGECLNPCTPSRPGRVQPVPSIPQPLQGSATTRDGHKCHQIHPPLTLQPLGFVHRYLWPPCTVCHLSLLSSRANYNYLFFFDLSLSGVCSGCFAGIHLSFCFSLKCISQPALSRLCFVGLKKQNISDDNSQDKHGKGLLYWKPEPLERCQVKQGSSRTGGDQHRDFSGPAWPCHCVTAGFKVGIVLTPP